MTLARKHHEATLAPATNGGAVRAYTLHHGDCLNVMREMADASVDAIVTDPPYELSFMGKAWDGSGIAYRVDMWQEALRVLKPGGYLLAFGGTRTYHRMAVAIEDAGFVLHPMLGWIFGSGFPKATNLSKQFDKKRDWSKVQRLSAEIKRARTEANLSLHQISETMQGETNGQYGKWYHRGGHMFFETGMSLPSRPEWSHLRTVLPIRDEFQDVYDEAEREVIGHSTNQNGVGWVESKQAGYKPEFDLTAPATPEAQQWDGWFYGRQSLKPAIEPICMAQKPVTGRMTDNVLAHGTGAVNIDGCRIDAPEGLTSGGCTGKAFADGVGGFSKNGSFTEHPQGRWPANVILDEAAARELDGTSRFFYVAKASRRERNAGLDGMAQRVSKRHNDTGPSDNAKPNGQRALLETNHHPTVKPISLMHYLVRLVTPPAGVVLDPFMGSGSTGCAAVQEGFQFIGIEQDAEYVEIARRRIAHYAEQNRQGTLPIEGVA